MTDLKLVAPDQPTALERLLLNAAANESPSAEQRMRVRLALGLPAVPVAPLPVAKAGRRALAAKSAVGGLVVASAALLWFSGVGRTPQLSPVLSNPAITVPTAAFPNLPDAAREPEPVAVPLPPVESAPDKAGSTKPSAKPGARVARLSSGSANASGSSREDLGSDMSEQLRLIDAARAAVAAGDGKSASSAVSSYMTRFPRGAFGQEASVLRIEAIDLQGNHAQAASLARSFLARHPNSPHVNVVQRIAGSVQ